MSEVRRTGYKHGAVLESIWSKKRKLIIYDVAIRNAWPYGLEAIRLTQAMSRNLDDFQMRGLRRILQRSYQRVYEAAVSRQF